MKNINIEKRLSDLEKRVTLLENKDTNDFSAPKKHKKQSIREFLSEKNLEGDTQKTLAIAYFIEIVEGRSVFSAEDLKQGFKNAKFKKPSNINDRVNQNIKQNFMMEAEEKKDGKKAWELTDTGEKEVRDNLNKQND